MAAEKIKKKVRFDYFQVFCYEIDKEKDLAIEKLYDITPILEKAENLKPKETMKPYRDDKARIQVIKKDKTSEVWELQLLRLRESNPPGIATDDGEFTIFELEDGKYIGESTTVLYDRKNCILVMQRSNVGFTPTGLQEYLNEITKTSSDLLFFKPILSGIDFKKITKSKIFRKVTLGIEANDLVTNTDEESNLYKLLKNFLKFNANKITIELSIGHGKKDESLNEALSYNIIKELYEKKFATQLEIGYKDNEDAKVEYIDLIEDRRIDVVFLELTKKDKLTHDKLYPEIKSIYLKRKNSDNIF